MRKMERQRHIREILKDLRNIISHSRDIGVKYYYKNDLSKVAEIISLVKAKRAEKKAYSENLSNIKELSSLFELVRSCTLCKLANGRKNVVFGEGDPNSILMLIGEAPGREEDITGRPFVGKSGELLTKMLRAINIERSEVFITSVIKCRPPSNRTPKAQEIDSCLPYLLKQIELIDPRLILCLGSISSKTLLGKEEPLSRLRGKFFDLNGRKVICTYHPAYLLRFGGAKQIGLKKEAWHDLQMLQREYERIKRKRD